MKTTMTRFTIAFCLVIANSLFPVTSQASNLTITAVTATATTVTFDISMKYSFNVVGVATSPENWDAAWIFVKYADCTSGVGVLDWDHLTLSSTAVDHTITGGVLQVDPTTDGMGVFIRRTSPGSNTTTALTATVTLKIAPALATANYQFKVFGIEMINIPANDFQVGDDWSSNRFNSITVTAAQQAAGIPTASVTLGGTGTTAGTLPAAYPMGTSSFYCMKYNITTTQWVDFFNTLSYDEQAANIYSTTGSPSNPIGTNLGSVPNLKVSVQGSALTTPKTPAQFTSTSNSKYAVRDWKFKGYLSFLDWAALRPMTELEYEKVGRGTNNRVSGEFIWGTSTAGSHAPTGTSTRVQASAGYYGNLYMQSVSSYGYSQLIINTTDQATAGGSAFTSTCGDGNLSVAGLADVTGWPDVSNTSGGAGTRAQYHTSFPMSRRFYYNKINIPQIWNGSYWTYFTARGVR